MVSRLDRQRPRNGPYQAWDNNRLRESFRGRSVYPRIFVTPTEVTAGTPGYFGPRGANVANLLELQALGDLDQTDAWEPGEYVLLANGRKAHWDGEAWAAGPVPFAEATGVTPGSPGSFTPEGAAPPESLAAIRAAGALGETDPWAEGEYVVLGSDEEVFWDGDSWEKGRAPRTEVTGVTAGTPGSFTPAWATIPADLAELQALGDLGETTAWSAGESVVLGDESEAHWDGDSWEEGAVPE